MEKGHFCRCRCFSSEVEISRGTVCTKGTFEKDPMNLIETNHKINVTSDRTASSNNSLKSHLDAKSFNMFLTL